MQTTHSHLAIVALQMVHLSISSTSLLSQLPKPLQQGVWRHSRGARGLGAEHTAPHVWQRVFIHCVVAGHIKASSVNDTPFAFYDIMPTFCDLAGIKQFAKRYINKRLPGDGFDGISIAPTLLGNDAAQKHRDYLYWEFHETDQIGVRMGNWKLVVEKGQPHLFNLVTDLHEDHDVASSHPDILSKMLEVIKKEHTPSADFVVTLPSY